MPMISDRVKAMDAGLWVLLWSQRQNAFHVEPLPSMLARNRAAYADNKPGDYRVLHIGYREEVDATADACRATIQARGKAIEWNLKRSA